MKFRVLGPLTVLDDNVPVVLSGIKQRATLGFLLLHANDVVATSTLLGALWPGGPAPATARKMLQNAVSALRGLLATDTPGRSPVLLTHAPGYLLRVRTEDLDLTAYQTLVDSGRAELAAGDWPTAARTLRTALDLWHGPVLADLADAGTTWPELTALARARWAVREDLFEAELACGRHQEIIQELETLTAAEPVRERLCAQLLLGLYRCGRQVDALEVHRRTRAAFAEKLGLEPGRLLRDMERAILDHDPVLAQPDALAIMAHGGEAGHRTRLTTGAVPPQAPAHPGDPAASRPFAGPGPLGYASGPPQPSAEPGPYDSVPDDIRSLFGSGSAAYDALVAFGTGLVAPEARTLFGARQSGERPARVGGAEPAEPALAPDLPGPLRAEDAYARPAAPAARSAAATRFGAARAAARAAAALAADFPRAPADFATPTGVPRPVVRPVADAPAAAREEAPRPPGPRRPPPALGTLTEQRKQLSMLLVRTALGKGLGGDPEDTARLAGDLAAAIRAEIERHGGKVSGVIGPVTYALFGVARTREDDAARAVQAGLALRDRLREYGAGGPVPTSGASAPRVAVATGEVLVTCAPDGSGAVPVVSGAVPDNCMGLLEQVPPGGIRVCRTTRVSSERAVEYAPQPPGAADGGAEPLRVRPQRPAALPPTPLVGRDREVEQLRGLLGDVRRRQRPHLLTVLGEAGLGKSRLATELVRLAGRIAGDFTVLAAAGSWADCDRPLAVLERIVAAAAGIDPEDPEATADEKLARTVHGLFGTGEEGGWVLERLRALLRSEQPAPAHWASAGEAWRRFLVALAAERPLVVVFEDLQRAGDPVLDFVEHLADTAGPVPMLVAVTARPELLDRRPDWGGGRRQSLTLTLDPLDPQSAGGLLDALLAEQAPGLRAGLRQDLLTHIGGNPLFAVEYARDLRERQPAEPAVPVLPRHVHLVIASRLDTLPPGAKSVLVDVSVLGGTASAEQVAAVGDGDRAEAARWLDHLERRDILRRSRHHSAVGGIRYSYSHPPTRDVVDSLVPHAVREDRQRRAAAHPQPPAPADLPGPRLAG